MVQIKHNLKVLWLALTVPRRKEYGWDKKNLIHYLWFTIALVSVIEWFKDFKRCR